MLSPLILFHDLLLLLRREVVLNVEELADFLNALVLDQRGNLGAGEFKQGLDVEVVAGHDKLKKNLLFKVDVVSVPGVDHGLHICRLERLLNFWCLMVFEVLAEVDNFFC